MEKEILFLLSETDRAVFRTQRAPSNQEPAIRVLGEWTQPRFNSTLIKPNGTLRKAGALLHAKMLWLRTCIGAATTPQTLERC
ncbi:hypothetical protein FXB40_11335 [Bradyrhizobium rifense]|uniref:Uncharacterized protein n=1 Tax=Bradyrhizobium rifense TaxID=515499 RepID=A0A5D3KUV9_9BRAD|nr:hypothetical protein [Bradyrhizobium rifense]TYL96628.1 hypothetical protein FXB40_11335 [Bradyrhizobium rifense]